MIAVWVATEANDLVGWIDPELRAIDAAPAIASGRKPGFARSRITIPKPA
jgi:hypothetical protein